VLALQADLASAIAREINVRLTESEESRFAAAPSVDPRAHDAYLRGRYYINRPSDENLQRAIGEFQEAVALDPTFAAAYSGLSDAYQFAGYNEGFMTFSVAKPLAREAAETAVALDGSSAEAHASLAVFRVYYELDWRGGEVEFRRAIALNPSYAYAHGEFALALALLGRAEEAEAEGRVAGELDPLSPLAFWYQAVPAMLQGDFDRADAFMRRAAELDPTYFNPAMVQGQARLQVGQFEEAVPLFERARSLGGPLFVTAYLAYAYAAAGDTANALIELDALREASPGGEAAPFNLAVVYLGLGDHDRVLEELERARDAGSTLLMGLGQDAIFDPLRGDPRFVALLRELGFPE
jgi:tetratricopeptide (TPR) repeat protein